MVAGPSVEEGLEDETNPEVLLRLTGTASRRRAAESNTSRLSCSVRERKDVRASALIPRKLSRPPCHTRAAAPNQAGPRRSPTDCASPHPGGGASVPTRPAHSRYASRGQYTHSLTMRAGTRGVSESADGGGRGSAIWSREAMGRARSPRQRRIRSGEGCCPPNAQQGSTPPCSMGRRRFRVESNPISS